jgi:hypothetical protein
MDREEERRRRRLNNGKKMLETAKSSDSFELQEIEEARK